MEEPLVKQEAALLAETEKEVVKAPSETKFADSPFAEPVQQRSYAESAVPVLDSVPQAVVVLEEPKKVRKGIVMSDIKVEQDPLGQHYKEQEQKSQQAFAEPEFDPYQNVEDRPMSFDAPTEHERPAHQASDVISEGQGAMSDFIYSNLAFLVPDTLHELSRIKEGPFQSQDWGTEIIEEALQSVREHNARQKRKFAWGEQHRLNIKQPLKAFLQQQGVEDAGSPAAMLLFGLLIISFTTFMTFRDVKKENNSMENRLLRSIEQIIQKNKPVAPVAATERELKKSVA